MYLKVPRVPMKPFFKRGAKIEKKVYLKSNMKDNFEKIVGE